MDISVQRLQFLDLTDATEHDHTFIEEVLFSPTYVLEVPWCSKNSEAVNAQKEKEWYNSSYNGDLEFNQDSIGSNQKVHENLESIENKSENCRRQGEHDENKAEDHSSSSSSQQEQVPHQRGIFPGHATSSLPHQSQPMFQMYQMLPSLSNVYVSNVTANVSVHAPYVQPIPTHYSHQVPPQQQQQQQPSPQQIYPSTPIEGNDQANRSRRQRQKTDKKRENPFVHPTEVVPPSIENHPPPQFPNIPPMPPYYLSGTPTGAPVYMMPVYPSPMFSPYPPTPAPMVYPQTSNLEHDSEEYHAEDPRAAVECPIRSDGGPPQRKHPEPSEKPHESQPPSGCQPSPQKEHFNHHYSNSYNTEDSVPFAQFVENVSKEDLNGNYYDKNDMAFNSKLETSTELTHFATASRVHPLDNHLEGPSRCSVPSKNLVPELNVNNVNKISVNIKPRSNSLAKEENGCRSSPTTVLPVAPTQITRLSTDSDPAQSPKPPMPPPEDCKYLPGQHHSEQPQRFTFPRGDLDSTASTQTQSSSAGKSWASLFNRSDQIARNAATSDVHGRPLARVQPYSGTDACAAPSTSLSSPPVPSTEGHSTAFPHISANGDLSTDPAPVIYDPYLHNLGVFLCNYELDHKIISLQPRGLTNRGNWCYVNAILQSLIACPPFYNLLKALPAGTSKKGSKQTLIVDALVDYVNEFSPMPLNARIGKREKSARNKDENTSVDVATGPAFEPSGIYKVLNKVRGGNSFNVEGRQEDAEEFLSCLLNGLNDEMFELMKMVNANKTSFSNGDANGPFEKNTEDDDDDDDDDDPSEWNVMGPKNKSSITRRAVCGKTPVSDIFRGQFRSRVQRAGDQSTDTVQPFFTLQLDIEKANSVKDALELFMGKDPLEGVTCSKTHREVEAWTQTTLEDLPLVLILHLKCYDYKSDACSKIIKTFDYQVDLKIDAKLLANRNKYTGKQRNYKLVAVVYHDGKEASKGHYVTDAYHVGYGCWVRYDDVSVRSVPESHVLKPRAPRVPYLLYYRRADTISSIK